VVDVQSKENHGSQINEVDPPDLERGNDERIDTAVLRVSADVKLLDCELEEVEDEEEEQDQDQAPTGTPAPAMA